jgi:ribonuclease J
MDAESAPGADELLFCPLGGTGEVGLNLYLYGHAGQWMMVDCGISFADETTPGVDLLLPDVRWIAERKDSLAGIVITHAHEDHIGAVPYLWRRLGAPVYGTPFTCSVLRRKLAEHGLEGEVPVHEIPVGGQATVGPFDLEFITITHSILEPSSILIRTPVGNLLHTGDWKLDPHPLVGANFDQKRLERLKDDNILALIGDSTNAMAPGHSGSEMDVRTALTELVGSLDNRVVMTCFATNVARLQTAAEVAIATGRSLCLVGRSMHNMVRAAQECGYLHDLPEMVNERDLENIPRDHVLLLMTGSQGESRSALSRTAREEHPNVVLEAGDHVIFSSRVIPGNEKAIHTLQNRLVQRNIEVLTEEDHFVHVSGHPCRDELTQMYQWVRPKIAVPMHGEPRHLLSHARLADSLQVPHSIVPADGTVIRLAPGDAPEIIDHVPVGRMALDGTKILPTDSGSIRERRKMGFAGVAVLTLVVDADGQLEDDPQLSAFGLFGEEQEDEEAIDAAIDAVEAAIQKLRIHDRRRDEILHETARLALRRFLQRETGRKPHTEVHLVRLE